MKKIIFISIFLFFSSHVAAWTINADFEKGAIGNNANGSDGFTDAFKFSKYTNAVVHSGKQAAVLGINAGTNGWADWGGSFVYPKPLSSGDELWFRVWAYFPPEFSFDCGGCTQGVKYMRIATESDKGGDGFHSILLKSSAVDIDSEVTGQTFHTNNSGKKTVGESNTKGRWHAYEMYMKFSSVPGNGIYRVWQNGNLIFEDKITKTLKTPSSMSKFIYLFTYWNSDAPKTQNVYVDDIVITNETPSETDAYGNSFIGLGGHKFISPPLPPTFN